MSWGVLISGNGGNLQAIMEEVKVNVVMASNAKAYGILRARRMGVPVEVVSDETQIWENILKYNVKNVFLAGYMKIISKGLVSKMQSRGMVLNVHPSLLPKHKGLKAFEAAIAAGDDVGVTVHHVVPEVDSGEFVLQKKIQAPSKLLLHINEQQVVRASVRRGRKNG